MKAFLFTLNNKKNIFIVIIIIGLVISFMLGIIVYYKFNEVFDDIDVQSMIGKYYDDEQEYAKAFVWYMRAGKRGHPVAQNNLGVLYQDGAGTKKNYKQAKKWYFKSARQGNALAANNLGYLFETTEQNYIKAVEWYQVSANKGYAVAQNNLGLKYQFGLGIQKDCNKALELYELAEKQGMYCAQYNIGLIYEQGCGDIQKNYAIAIEWYKKAASNGLEGAKQKLKELDQTN